MASTKKSAKASTATKDARLNRLVNVLSVVPAIREEVLSYFDSYDDNEPIEDCRNDSWVVLAGNVWYSDKPITEASWASGPWFKNEGGPVQIEPLKIARAGNLVLVHQEMNVDRIHNDAITTPASRRPE
jgi:hypothetical protein